VTRAVLHPTPPVQQDAGACGGDDVTEHEGKALDTGRAHGRRTELPSITSASLFKAARELIIEHAGECYRLRITKNGKLILTK
jgi:hemin uptake protein HemP